MISTEAKVSFSITIFWFCAIFFSFHKLAIINPADSPSEIVSTKISERINNIVAQLDVLKRNNVAIMRKFRDREFRRTSTEKTTLAALLAQDEREPLEGFEETRRKLEEDMKEMWYNLRGKQDLQNETVFGQLEDIYRTLQGHIIKLRDTDGYEAYRKKETDKISAMVQERLHLLQNPANCSTAQKLICGLNKACGFGCQIHHAVYCLVVAYATGRTLILESQGWRYNSQGWEQVFLPISTTCTEKGNSTPIHFETPEAQDSLVVGLPEVDFLQKVPEYLPVAVPTDIADRIGKIHGEPHIWWVGQFLKYLLRLQPYYKSVIERHITKLGISNTEPTVGIHVRRTDKIGSEAAFHNLDEYMDVAREHFSILEKAHGHVKRRVFIASDDPIVISEAKERYTEPEWTVLADTEVAKSASVDRRNEVNGLIGIMKDIFALASSDFIICTFSSQVCRLAYELMQTKQADASGRFVSIDDPYYYGGGKGTFAVVIIPHTPRDDEEIDLAVGDKIEVAGNHWNGTTKGKNLRTQKVGLYPSYKTKYLMRKVDFPHIKWWLRNTTAV